uniref:Putative secreted protein n=1 Tax=Amblyomma triste TaxID=251400 RepID=A0A023G3M8_AMBTT
MKDASDSILIGITLIINFIYIAAPLVRSAKCNSQKCQSEETEDNFSHIHFAREIPLEVCTTCLTCDPYILQLLKDPWLVH